MMGGLVFFLVFVLSVVHRASAAVDLVLAVGLSMGLGILFFVGIPTCLVCVVRCYMATRTYRSSVGTARTTSTAAPDTQPVQQHSPTECKAEPQEAPPPYPAHGYPHPLSLPTTGCAPPSAGDPQTHPQSAPPPYDGPHP